MLAPSLWQPITYQGVAALESVATDGARIVVLQRGAQLLSWRDSAGTERFYLSPQADLSGESPIRGGVPIIFPQFGHLGKLARHGLARLAQWEMREGERALQWHHHSEMTTLWPHDCLCILVFNFVDHGLRLSLSVTNTGQTALAFTAALHSYLAADSQAAHIIGLDPEPRSLRGPRDQIINQAPAKIMVRTPQHLLQSTRAGFSDVVLWNPGPDHSLADLALGEELNFVCVEAAQLTSIHLLPGQSWYGNETWTLIA